jgi:NAD+ diphosphatase
LARDLSAAGLPPHYISAGRSRGKLCGMAHDARLPGRRRLCHSGHMRAPNFYAAPGFERAGLKRRDMDWLRDRLARPESVFVPVWRNQNLVLERAGMPRAVLFDTTGIAAALGRSLADESLFERGEIVFLGTVAERAHFALDLSPHEAPLDMLRSPALAASGQSAADLRFVDLRRIGALLDRHEGALLAFARAMLFWHSRHRFCGICGSPTRSEEAGHMRRCTDPGCEAMHFPRTDPAVIMLVTDGERALLGRNKNFPLPGMYSTLAGLVEPGESLEDAVAREVREETGIVVGPAVYHSSQPWPFPANIMLGFHARALTREITIDFGELEDARWFTRDFLSSHADDDTFRLPRRDSIARRLIEDWLAGEIAP